MLRPGACGLEGRRRLPVVAALERRHAPEVVPRLALVVAEVARSEALELGLELVFATLLEEPVDELLHAVDLLASTASGHVLLLPGGNRFR